jgi:hypothetical protein
MFKGILFDNVISLEKRPYASFGSHALDVALSVYRVAEVREQ